MKKLVISCALGLAVAAYGLAAAAQCTVDTDCKGDRICQGGQCVAPAPEPAPAPATATAYSSSAAPTSSGSALGGGGGFKPFVVGGVMEMGLAHSFIEVDGEDDDEAKPRFAGGGGAYFDYYLMPIFALEAGIGFIGKGVRYKEDDARSWVRVIYMEIPLGVKLNIHNFQVGAAVALSFALSGKYKFKDDDNEATLDFDDDDWDNYRRFNLCPRITAGYAIPIGPIAVVPGIMWEIEVINTAKGDLADDADGKIHNMNFMITAAAEFGFGA